MAATGDPGSGQPAQSSSPPPRFTFAAGNARKLLALPLYALGGVATRLVDRSPDRWVFGCATGIGDGALALYRAAAEQDRSRRLTWVVATDAEAARAEALGIRWVRKGTWAAFHETLRAGVAVLTHGFGDVDRYAVRGALVVQLWHGTPIKRLHLDTRAALTLPVVGDRPIVRRFLTAFYRRGTAAITVLPVSSPTVAPYLASAFGLPLSRVPVLGEPRTDVLFAGPFPARRTRARQQLADALQVLDLGERPIVLYAPTWRDGSPDPGIPTAAEWGQIEAFAQVHNALVVMRPHRLGVGAYAHESPWVRLLDPDLVPEVMGVLPGVDVLVTDYSSMLVDAAAIGRPVVFFAPDEAHYTASRGLYRPYEETSGGRVARTWTEVLGALTALAESPEARADVLATSRELAERYHTHTDGHSADRVLQWVLEQLSGAGPSRTPLASDGQPLDDLVEPRRVVREVEVDLATPAVTVRLDPETIGRLTMVALVGPRLRLDVPVLDGVARVDLLARAWGGPPLPLPSGRYAVVCVEDGRQTSLAPAPGSDLGTGPWVGSDLRLRMEVEDGLTLTVEPPLTDDELARPQDLVTAYRTSTRPLQPAVFFESFYGRNASCNPLAIDRELAARRPDLTRFWSVVDRSVQVPAGAVPVVIGSQAWWEARAVASAYVINDWLTGPYVRRSGQLVLQTWHGTPLKRIALARRWLAPRQVAAIVKQSRRWSVTLAQSRSCARSLRRAYAIAGTMWTLGYPRNDVLLTGDALAVRDRLGVGERRIVLYAPTWRDDQDGIVDLLDLDELTARLGPDWVVLVRGHSRTLDAAALHDVAAAVLDVSTYPDASDLLLVCDVLVTDYSSVMFDVSARTTPMVFFVPDLQDYASRVRGLLWDLSDRAPGPVVTTTAEVAEAVLQAQDDAPRWAGRYSAWRLRFNPLDDGRAAERVVDRLLQHLP